jgi:hypothetical protein
VVLYRLYFLFAAKQDQVPWYFPGSTPHVHNLLHNSAKVQECAQS